MDEYTSTSAGARKRSIGGCTRKLSTVDEGSRRSSKEAPGDLSVNPCEGVEFTSSDLIDRRMSERALSR